MKNPRHYTALLVILYFCQSVLAQNYTNYTEKDGLASNYVYRCLQDHDGFMWFITDKGISKFDGKTFKNFTTKQGLPTNEIWHIRITPDNRVWYFTRSDRLGYIKNDSVYAFYSNTKDMMNPNGLIFQSGNEISFIHGYYHYRFKDSLWVNDNIAVEGIKLLNKNLLVDISKKKYKLLLNPDGGIIHKFSNLNYSTNLLQYSDSLLVFSNNQEYEIFNLNNNIVKSGTLSNLNRNPEIKLNQWFDLTNNQLQLSNNSWLITFDDQLNIKQEFVIPKQLNSTHNVQDRDGFVWVHTNYNGVYKLPIDFEKIQYFFKDEVISRVREIEGEVFVAILNKGVYKIVNKEPKLIFKNPSKVFNMTKIGDLKYFILHHYMVIENNNIYRTLARDKPFPLGKNLVYYEGAFFTEGFSGMTKLDLHNNTSHYYIDHTSYQGLFRNNDSLFAFNFKSMLRYSSEKNRFVDYKNIKIGTKVNSTENFESATYIGTEGDGLYVFNFGKLYKLAASDDAIINHISVENENSIWTVSEGVLLHYFKKENGEFAVKKHRHINGLTTNNVTDVLVFKKQLYIGSTNGLTIISISDISEVNNYSPYIKYIYANNKKQKGDSISLIYDTNLNLKINFGAINFFDTEEDIYQYRLSPEQKNWTTTASGEVNLYNLPPDEYVLMLKVKQDDSEKIINLPITIVPKWWQKRITKTFVIVLGILVLGLFFYQYRKHELAKKMKKIQSQKKLAEHELHALRSQMNPHFVFNSLAAIQYYINENDFENSEKYLVKFSQLIRKFFELSKEEEITVAEEINLLQTYLEIEKLRFKDKLSFKFIVDGHIDTEHTIIPTMLLQPVVENAVNHGIFNKDGAGTITITFKLLEEQVLSVEIIDDGVGFEKTKKKNKEKINSSVILNDRLFFLNQSEKWELFHTISEAFPNDLYKGVRVTFTIKTT